MSYPALWNSKEGIKTLVIAIVFEVLAVLAVISRIFSRRIQRTNFAFNDYAIFLALAITSGLVSVLILAIFWAGTGHHVQEIAPDKLGRVFWTFAPGQILWAASNTCVKISILHLYIKIFPSVTFRRMCYGMMALSTCYFLSVLLEAFLLCKPVEFNWDKLGTTGTCANENLAYLLAAITNLIIDVLIVALPMPMLWRLQLSSIKKLNVSAMFGLGAVICIISLLRVIYVRNLNLADFWYSSAGLANWSVLEPTLGIVNACLPVLRPVAQKILGSKVFAWGSGRGKDSAKAISRRPFSYGVKRGEKCADNGDSRLSSGAERQLYALDTISGSEPSNTLLTLKAEKPTLTLMDVKSIDHVEMV